MRAIWKYLVPLMGADVEHDVRVPALFVGAVMQGGSVAAYFEVDDAWTETIKTKLRVFGTGHEIPGPQVGPYAYRHLATLADRDFVWHLCRLGP